MYPEVLNPKTSNIFKINNGSVLYLKPIDTVRYPASEDESMIKLARYLSDKRMRLVDMFRILDKQNKFEMDKTEFMRRMKVKYYEKN